MTAVDRDLLFGLLAFQNVLINQAQLAAAFQAWTLDRSRPLADHLVSLGHLNDAQRAAVEAMADLHVASHGDPEKSLAAISVGRSTRESLKRIGDPDVERTLSRVGSESTEDEADRTAAYSVGIATSEGQRFRVLRPHARGGLGAVFVALDTELHREVALKQILEYHADNETSRRRFLLEAEITGGLEHPGIVPVYGLGSYSDGRPYYAMRFIRGDSLKEAVDRFHSDETLKSDPGRRSLELLKLLRRFTDVCNAIEYAHSRGVLHRDLKPGNIIVGKHGETLVVDWGLGKVVGQTDSNVDERTLTPGSTSGGSETQPGSVLGTPAYMSPEQAEGRLDHLGPRSDVYSLGATLYCLLTGRPPFVGEVADVIRAVQRGDVPAPRAVEPTLDRALEAVCLKAMALKPEDRYGSCRALAEDVERWMADEPVSAWREPIPRRARRWGRHHRTAVTAAAVALVAGVVGLAAVAGVQARANGDLRKSHDATRAALGETRKAQAETQAALAQSEESRNQAEAVSTFLVEAFRSADPSEDGKDVKVADLLDRASRRLEEEFDGSEATRGALLDALGQTYTGLGLIEPAVHLMERAGAVREAAMGADHPDTLATRIRTVHLYAGYAGRTAEAVALGEGVLKLAESRLGPDHPVTLQSRSGLAVAYHHAGRTAEATAMDEETLKLRASKLGADHPDTLESRNNLAQDYIDAGRAAEAVDLHRRSLALAESKHGPNHPVTFTVRNNLAQALHLAGGNDEALKLNEETLRLREAKLGPDHPDALASRNNLAQDYLDAGRTAEAVELHRTTLALAESKLGPDHPVTLIFRNNLAQALHSAGEYLEALKLNERTLRLREAKLGPDHPDALASRNNLAQDYLAAGRAAEAVELHRTTLTLAESKFGPDHPVTLIIRNNLAQALHSAGEYLEALKLNERTLALRETKLGPDHPDTFASRNNLAQDYLAAGRAAEAAELHRTTLALAESKFGPDHPITLTIRNNLGQAYLAVGRTIEATALHEETLRLRKVKLGSDHPHTLISMNNLAQAYLAVGRTAEAVALHEATVKLCESKLGPGHPQTLAFRANLALAYEVGDRWADAEALRRDTLAERRKVKKPDSSLLAGDLASMGRNLLRQRRAAEAEPLLREALAIRAKTTPDDWSRYNAMSLLGGALLGQAHYADADPLVVSGYEGMKGRQGRISAPNRFRLREAAGRVIRLYEAWGKPDQASLWKARLGMLDLPAEVFARP